MEQLRLRTSHALFSLACIALISMGCKVPPNTLLHYMETHRDQIVLAQVRWLVKRGSSVLSANAKGETPLFYAVRYAKPEVSSYLLSKGADVNWQNRRGLTALHIAARFGRLQHIKMLLRCGANVHIASKNGQTPLLSASRRAQRLHLKLKWMRSTTMHKTERRCRWKSP